MKLGHPFISLADAEVSFRKEDLCVKHVDPSRFLLLRILFIALRAPHRATEFHFQETWWSETRTLCSKLAQDMRFAWGLQREAG